MALAIVFRTMSGLSKWSQIKRQKGANDVKRGAIFTKMDRARAVNVPLANIQRAIDKAVGGAEGAQVESIMYEGYGPGGVSIMVEAATDSRNRTAAEVRAAFTRHNGKLGESGSVQWLFEQKGIIEIDAKGRSADEIELAAIDAGAEDVEADGELVTIYTAPNRFETVKKALEAQKLKIADAEVSMRPSNTVRLEGEQAKKVIGLVEALEDLDDVQKVHANFDVPEEVLETA